MVARHSHRVVPVNHRARVVDSSAFGVGLVVPDARRAVEVDRNDVVDPGTTTAGEVVRGLALPNDGRSRETSLRLVKGLQERGGTPSGETLFAPHRSMWLPVRPPWQHDLADMLDRMRGRAERVRQLLDAEMPDGESLARQETLQDVEGLVEVLVRIAEDHSGDGP